MSESQYCAIRVFPVDDTDWTPVIAPIDCDYFGILSGPAMSRCSDPGNPSSAYPMPVPQYALAVPPIQRNWGKRRFSAGDAVTYLKSSSGSGQAAVEFIV